VLVALELRASSLPKRCCALALRADLDHVFSAVITPAVTLLDAGAGDSLGGLLLHGDRRGQVVKEVIQPTTATSSSTRWVWLRPFHLKPSTPLTATSTFSSALHRSARRSSPTTPLAELRRGQRAFYTTPLRRCRIRSSKSSANSTEKTALVYSRRRFNKPQRRSGRDDNRSTAKHVAHRVRQLLTSSRGPR